MKHILAIVTCALALGGCASATTSEAVQAQAAIWQYCEAASSGPETAVIAGKTFVKQVTEVNAAMLSDPATPTQEEADALKSLDARRSVCRQKLVAWDMQYEPGLAPILQHQFYKQEIALGDLIHRTITYGDANRRIYEAYLEANTLATNESKAEQQQRNAAVMEYIRHPPQPPVLPPEQLQPYRPPPLNQNPSINCTTSYVGNQAYTHCY